MARQELARFLDRFHEGIREILVSEMGPHFLDELLPESIAAFLVNAFIPNHSKLSRARGHKNQDRVSLVSRLHSQLLEPPSRIIEGVAVQFAPLHVDPNLAGGLRFGLFDRSDDAIMIELLEEILGSHCSTSSRSSLRRRNFRRPH